MKIEDKRTQEEKDVERGKFRISDLFHHMWKHAGEDP